jgi:hypothetical protein
VAKVNAEINFGYRRAVSGPGQWALNSPAGDEHSDRKSLQDFRSEGRASSRKVSSSVRAPPCPVQTAWFPSVETPPCPLSGGFNHLGGFRHEIEISSSSKHWQLLGFISCQFDFGFGAPILHSPFVHRLQITTFASIFQLADGHTRHEL